MALFFNYIIIISLLVTSCSNPKTINLNANDLRNRNLSIQDFDIKDKSVVIIRVKGSIIHKKNFLDWVLMPKAKKEDFMSGKLEKLNWSNKSGGIFYINPNIIHNEEVRSTYTPEDKLKTIAGVALATGIILISITTRDGTGLGAMFGSSYGQFQKEIPDSYQAYYIEPGFYYLDYILPDSRYINPRKPGLDLKNHKPNYISFEAKPGEVVYIGNLEFNFTHTIGRNLYLNINVKDNFQEAQDYFHKTFPQITKPITKRLAERGIIADGKTNVAGYW